MGVVRNFNVFGGTNAEDDWIYLSSDGEETRPPQDHKDNLALNLRKPRSNRVKCVNKPEPTFMALGVRGKGQKKIRRYDNANLIMGSLVNENELEAISITDFVPAKRSPFLQLLQNLEYDEFLNYETHDHQLASQPCTEEIELEEVTLDANSCFSRVQAKLRRELLKKNFPVGILSSIETGLVEFFQHQPSALYHIYLPGSYHRMLLHACCQYLNLNCQSTDSHGKRISMVKNRRQCFHLPVQLLSDYLSMFR